MNLLNSGIVLIIIGFILAFILATLLYLAYQLWIKKSQTSFTWMSAAIYVVATVGILMILIGGMLIAMSCICQKKEKKCYPLLYHKIEEPKVVQEESKVIEEEIVVEKKNPCKPILDLNALNGF